MKFLPKLKPYRGPLTSSQIAEGMNAARENAARLAKDARLLFDNQRFASAFALAALAIEEVGKEPILRGMAAQGDAGLKEAWRDYTSHTKKNGLWILMGKLVDGARRLKDFLPMFEPDAKHTMVLDQLKQFSLYTDRVNQVEWSIPEKRIPDFFAKYLVLSAEVLCRTRHVTAEEVDLWIQYMRPVWTKNDGSREKALIEWDKEVRRRGLVTDGDPMEKFMVEGITMPDNF